VLTIRCDIAPWHSIELASNQHARRCRNLLAKVLGKVADAVPILYGE